MSKFTMKYFIKKFEAIPDELWCVGATEQEGKHCALGHLGFNNLRSGCPAAITENLTEEVKALAAILAGPDWPYEPWQKITSINDSAFFGEGHASPRQNILDALYSKLRSPATIK